MPCTSAVRAVASTSITPVRPETSSPGAVVSARGRKRLDVFLASRTGALGGIAAYDARRRSTAAAWSAQAPPVLTPDNLLPFGVRSVSGEAQVESLSANTPFGSPDIPAGASRQGCA